MALTAAEVSQLASDPHAASVDGQSVTSRAADDVIKLDNYAISKTAAAQRRRGISFSQLLPPGTMPDSGVTAGYS